MEKLTTEFYAMEYVNVIGNRILKVWVTDEYIFAAKVKGLTSEGISVREDSKFIIHHSKRNDPKAYANSEQEIKYDAIDFYKISPKEFQRIHPENFVIHRDKITSVDFNPNKKWGMGNYPHNGRITIKSGIDSGNKKRKREFILIGLQDAKPILSHLNAEYNED